MGIERPKLCNLYPHSSQSRKMGIYTSKMGQLHGKLLLFTPSKEREWGWGQREEERQGREGGGAGREQKGRKRWGRGGTSTSAEPVRPQLDLTCQIQGGRKAAGGSTVLGLKMALISSMLTYSSRRLDCASARPFPDHPRCASFYKKAQHYFSTQ